jgi:hypothetical protein
MPLRYLFILLALSLLGCPSVRVLPDVGEDAFGLDAPDHLDGGMRERDATDPRDGGVDASRPDAFVVCDCDDGISCTRDLCDATGACIHEVDCGAGEYCNREPDGCLPTDPCTIDADCFDQPCQPTTGCRLGRCAYQWAPDQDGDGNPSVGCGGTDCQPRDPTRPSAEVCNRGEDDDCDGRFDEDGAVSSDVWNCGACSRSCDGADLCVEGVCRCSGVGRVACADPGRSYECFDGLTDPLHCGDGCALCPGTTVSAPAVLTPCEAGLCRYRAAWMHGVDAGLMARVFVAPNGDVVLASVGRPTQLFHQGRATEAIPPGPSPFPRHVIRLDRDGNLVGVTSIPDVFSGDDYSGSPRSTLLAVTDAGFYFAGKVAVDTDVLGTRYTAEGPPVIGYVPRSTSEIAWAQPLTVRIVYTSVGTRDGSLVLLVANPSDARPGEEIALRRFNIGGVELPRDERYDVNFLRFASTVFPSAAGGFIVPNRTAPSIPGVTVHGDSGEHAALIFDADGLLRESVAIGSSPTFPLPPIFDEREDASAWLTYGYGLDECTRTSRRHLGGGGSLAAFDESGVVTVTPGFNTSQVDRLRDGRIVESVMLPNVISMEEGSLWLINYSLFPRAEEFSIPGASTISRVDLPPIL